MEKLHHDDVARDIEQQFDKATYCESEGPDTTRVDFGSTSIWVRPSTTHDLAIEGRISGLLKHGLKLYLIDTYGTRIDISGLG